MRPRSGGRTAAALLALTTACGPAVPEDPADLILVDGNVITVDPAGSIAEAVAIRDDRIAAVGTTAEIEALAGPATRRVELEGRTVTPGLLDVHLHFANSGPRRLFALDLSYPNVESVADVVGVVAEQASRLAEDEWVQGGGWDEGKFEELRYIYAADLDSVSRGHPVWLSHTMGHYGVANSRALEMAGITAETPDPPGGTIDRYLDGTPTGVLKESAQGLVSRMVPRFTPEQRHEGMVALVDELNAECMTGFKDPGISGRAWQTYRDVLAAGDLTARAFVLWSDAAGDVGAVRAYADSLAEFTRPYESSGDDHLIAGGVKLYIDGSGGARTAWLYDDWNMDRQAVDSGNRGYPTMDPDALADRFRAYHDAGLHVSIHSIGDRAIDWTMDTYAEALEENPIQGLRHGIIHSNIPTDHALDLMATLQREWDAGYPEVSPGFTWWIGDTYAGNFGPERSRRLNPLRSYLDRGIRWASGSDYYVTPFPARYGLWASVARRPLLGVWGDDAFGTDESVDIAAALRSYTIHAAYQMFMEDLIGSIEPGKYADLAVWSQDMYSIPTAELENLVCDMTVFDGRVVFRRTAGG